MDGRRLYMWFPGQFRGATRFICEHRLAALVAAGKAYGGLCEFCSYEGPFELDEASGEYRCPQCGKAPREAPEDEWLG